MRAPLAIVFAFFLACTSFALLFAQAPAQAAGAPSQPEFIKQGQQLIRDGKPEEALALYRQTLKETPNSTSANIAAGSVLDSMGKGEEARKYFATALLADAPARRRGPRPP